jgi:hypothetical protein
MLDEKANIFKVRYLHGKHGRKCGRHKREGECALPGEVSSLACTATTAERPWEERREVSRGHSSPSETLADEGLNVK